MSHQAYPIPRLPVLSPAAFVGAADPGMPCLLSLPRMSFTTSGRASILLGLEALGIGAGDGVLLPTYHCPTMVAPVAYLKAKPVFYPLDKNGGPSLDCLNEQDLRQVRVLLVAHFFGLPQPMAHLRKWCDERGIALLEDCAHALFGSSEGRPIGAWGDIAIGSLTKFLPLTVGGCLVLGRNLPQPRLSVSAAPALARVIFDVVELSAQHGRLPGLNRFVTGSLAALRSIRRTSAPQVEETDPTRAPSTAGAAAMGEIDVTVAHQSLPSTGRWLALRLPRSRIVERRRLLYARLSSRLSGQLGMVPLMPILPPDCAPYVFPLWVADPDPGYATLRAMRMPVSRWDWLWPSVPKIDGDHGVQWSHHVLQIGCHQDLSDAELDAVVRTLLTLYGALSPGVRQPISIAHQQFEKVIEVARS
jgi:perosamine synthetase